MHYEKRIVIIGATSAMAEQCARSWVRGRAVDLTLVGRDLQRLERVAADLRVRSAQSMVRIMVSDFADATRIGISVEKIIAEGRVDLVLIAQGTLPDQRECQERIEACQAAMIINAVSPALFAEAFAKHFDEMRSGTLALIGSVAGDRGRKSNYVYGAAKGLLTRYAQGLQHRFAGTDIKVVLIKPGPTDTPMTSHLKAGGARMASVQSVAESMVAAIERGTPTVYVPARWGIVMMVIRHLPRFVFNRLEI